MKVKSMENSIIKFLSLLLAGARLLFLGKACIEKASSLKIRNVMPDIVM